MLWIIAVIIFLIWAAGYAFKFGGDLIHLLLVALVVVVIGNLLFAGKNNKV